MKAKYLFLFLIGAIFFDSATAQSPENIKGNAAFLFAYNPKEGQENQFNEGYKSHLEWHRRNADPFVWYGWYVLSGDRVGMFIDGTFGISYEAFDNRVAPAEDIAHFQRTTAPYADVAYRKVFKLLEDLSTGTVLENRNPAGYIDAYIFSLFPGKEPEFEEVVSRLVSKLKNEGIDQQFTFYRKLTGGNLPTYLMMVHHSGFAAFDSDQTITTLSHLTDQYIDESTAREMLDQLSQCIRNIYGETWHYRSDLSYFPE